MRIEFDQVAEGCIERLWRSWALPWKLKNKLLGWLVLVLFFVCNGRGNILGCRLF
jgi:hypothetical protein